ncbi:Dihydroxy-acid dehydratase [Sulfitobacter guttiformis KCTC 32187]|nr:Dihydroxy-acid dehydratase [Sulfitobacter guttiformis KCTC 32187]
MRGNVTLVPPAGYCIDPDSLSQSFALMARCDNLGAATGGEGAPAGVLSVSLARSSADTPLPTAQDLAKAAGVATPRETRQSNSSIIFKTTGPAPAGGLSPHHWRSVAQVGNFIMSASLFGPIDKRAVSEEGATVLEEMISRTSDKTKAG